MKIGVASIYSFRPHVEMLVYLSQLLNKGGHETFFLTCTGAVPNCYSRLIKRSSKIRECPICILGGFHSYPVKNLTRMHSEMKEEISDNMLTTLLESTSYTLCRTETQQDRTCTDVLTVQQKLHKSAEITYANTKKWISENRLDGVLCFNGRLDLNRVVMQACKDMGVPVICTESAMYGHGIEMIFNDNCQTIRQFDYLINQYTDKPLTKSQALYAAKLSAGRFLRQNVFEWRVFNKDAVKSKWPIERTNKKVLILPSSRNEFDGHPDWSEGWDDYTVALEKIINKLNIDYTDCVLRSHPIWGEKVGGVVGERSERYYETWARAKGIYFIPSTHLCDTYRLIQEADLVLLSGGSPGIEAGICGKKIVQYGHSFYRNAGFTIRVLGENDLHKLEHIHTQDTDEVIRRALRFVYLQSKRYPQYVDFIRAKSVSERQYFDGADPERIIKLFTDGVLIADDEEFADTTVEEDEIVELVKMQKWHEISNIYSEFKGSQELFVNRHRFLKIIDKLRALLPVGDRL